MSIKKDTKDKKISSEGERRIEGGRGEGVGERKEETEEGRRRGEFEEATGSRRLFAAFAAFAPFARAGQWERALFSICT